MLKKSIFWPCILLLASPTHAGQATWSFPEPGKAAGLLNTKTASLSNGSIGFTWSFSPFKLTKINSSWASKKELVSTATPFRIVLKSGRVLTADQMKVVTEPTLGAVPVQKASPCFAEGIEGKQLQLKLIDPESGLEVAWKGILRNGSNYLRQEFALTPTKQAVDVADIVLVDATATTPEVSGTVKGSPVVAGQWFFGLEHPMANSTVKGSQFTCNITRSIALQPGITTSYSSVIGVSPKGQMRRGFQRYVERERARPYKPFLHYNSWYDLGYFTKFKDTECVGVINAYADELVHKRDVKMDSFLFDDGWDDTATAWEFHSGFPKGFSPLKEAAEKIGADPGIWLSPWGGYGDPHTQRVATAKKLGYETDENGYALSGPKYYKRFHEVCLDLVEKYGINQFKFDGTGSPDKQYPGSEFGSDFEAAIQLIKDLRIVKPSLFINLTTGTWPSPFWTRYADSIWRGGYDHGFAGVGSKRQQWMTYRDADTYHGIVQSGPLFPVNSLMLHGLIYAQHADHLNTDPDNDFGSEVWSYFGTGTQLQEMYISPKLLNTSNWDDLAEAAKWARANASVLEDSHWIGGDPSLLEVYGHAAWNGKRGTIVLRNPSDKTQAYSIDLVQVFELPSSVSGTYTVKHSRKADAGKAAFDLTIGKSKVIELKPFEVVVLEAQPK